MFMQVAWWKPGLLQPLLQNTSPWPTEGSSLSDRAMAGCLPNNHHPVAGSPTDQWSRDGDILMFLAKPTGQNVLVERGQGFFMCLFVTQRLHRNMSRPWQVPPGWVCGSFARGGDTHPGSKPGEFSRCSFVYSLSRQELRTRSHR